MIVIIGNIISTAKYLAQSYFSSLVYAKQRKLLIIRAKAVAVH